MIFWGSPNTPEMLYLMKSNGLFLDFEVKTTICINILDQKLQFLNDAMNP